jgi:hypothetical protein
VVNPKFSEKPIPVEFFFNGFRLGIKVYIEAKPVPNQQMV